MSVTVANVGQGPGRNLLFVTDGNEKRTVTDVTFTSAYTDSGEPLTAADLGLQSVSHATAKPVLSATNAVDAAFAGYDPATDLLHVYDQTPAELANASGDATGLVVRVVAYGW